LLLTGTIPSCLNIARALIVQLLYKAIILIDFTGKTLLADKRVMERSSPTLISILSDLFQQNV
jgi:hypothetical protein